MMFPWHSSGPCWQRIGPLKQSESRGGLAVGPHSATLKNFFSIFLIVVKNKSFLKKIEQHQPAKHVWLVISCSSTMRSVVIGCWKLPKWITRTTRRAKVQTISPRNVVKIDNTCNSCSRKSFIQRTCNKINTVRAFCLSGGKHKKKKRQRVGVSLSTSYNKSQTHRKQQKLLQLRNSIHGDFVEEGLKPQLRARQKPQQHRVCSSKSRTFEAPRNG